MGLKGRQRVDLTALIIGMSVPRREVTTYGQKDIVDITVVDGSKTPGEAQQVSAKIAVFFEVNVKGAASLAGGRHSKGACRDVRVDVHPSRHRNL